MALDTKAVLADIDAALAEYKSLRQKAKYDDLSDLGEHVIASTNTRVAATVERYSEPGSRYVRNMRQIVDRYEAGVGAYTATLVGVLAALRDDIAAGRLATVTELIHADVFSDFLDMATHLLAEGYKDPAAVLAGGVLEEHLRKLCAKHAIAVVDENGRPRKADALNGDLANASVYSKLDLKNVTAWLDLRNKAAHGQYGAYTTDQVALLIQSVRDFVTRVPA